MFAQMHFGVCFGFMFPPHATVPSHLITVCYTTNGFQVLLAFLLERPGRERNLESRWNSVSEAVRAVTFALGQIIPEGSPPIRRLQVGRRGHLVGRAAKRRNKFRKSEDSSPQRGAEM